MSNTFRCYMLLYIASDVQYNVNRLNGHCSFSLQRWQLSHHTLSLPVLLHWPNKLHQASSTERIAVLFLYCQSHGGQLFLTDSFVFLTPCLRRCVSVSPYLCRSTYWDTAAGSSVGSSITMAGKIYSTPL